MYVQMYIYDSLTKVSSHLYRLDENSLYII